jgi:chromosomal replication initiator protein
MMGAVSVVTLGGLQVNFERGAAVVPGAVLARYRYVRGPAVAEIVRIAEGLADLAPGDICGLSRLRGIAWPRQAVMLALHIGRPSMSYPMIGAKLGGRDHTTIMHGVKRARARVEDCPDFARLVDALVDAVRS